MELEAYRRLTSLIFAAALDPARWGTLLDEMRRMMPGMNTQLFGYDLQTGDPIVAMVSGYEDDWIDAFERYYGRINPWAEVFTTAPEGQVMPAQQMCRDAVLDRTEFYADWVRPQGDIRGGGGAVLARSRDTTFLIGANIPARHAEALQGPWLQLVADLMPALQHAWTINRKLGAAAIECAAARAAEAGDPAVCVIGEGGRLRYANARAAALLEAGAPLRTDPLGRVRIACSRLQAAVDSVAEIPSRTTPLRGTLADAAGRLWTLSVCGFDPSAIEDWPAALVFALDRPAALLVLTPAAEDGDLAERLRSALGLSRAEAEIALALADGHTAEEIAAERGVSRHTVRNQIKAAMARCGARRQLDLAVLAVRVAGSSRSSLSRLN